jgi:hypothetical protein
VVPPPPGLEEAQVVLGQGRQVFPPLAQRRQRQRDDVQAEEQVLPEAAGGDLVFERAAPPRAPARG